MMKSQLIYLARVAISPRSALHSIRWGWLAALALLVSVLPAAALPPLKQTFFVPFPEADLQTSLKAIDTTGTAVGAAAFFPLIC